MPSEHESPRKIWFDPDVFSAARIQRGVTWGRPLRLLESTHSTNDLALAAIPGEDKTGIVWLAREQTAGRGRRGNAWLAPAGENLTFSVLLRIAGPPKIGGGFSLLAGLAVRALVASRLPAPDQKDAVCLATDDAATQSDGRKSNAHADRQSPALRATVKWPNDVLIDGKKCAGILVESKTNLEGQLGIVVGVGLNVLTQSFPEHLPQATSLLLGGAPASRLAFEQLLVDLLGELEQRTRLYLVGGTAALLEELGQHDFLRGRRVKIGEQQGVASGFDSSGRLRLLQDDGSVVFVTTGHVEL